MKRILCLLIVVVLFSITAPAVCAANNESSRFYLPVDNIGSKDSTNPDAVLLAVNTYDENNILNSSTQFEYDDNGLIARSVHTSYYNGTPSDGGYDYTYTYDEAGRLLCRNISNTSWGIKYDDIIRSYNDKGLLFSDAFYSEGEISSKSEYEYNEDGRPVREHETTTSPFVGSQVENEYSYSYHSNESGELVGVRHNETNPSADDVEFVYNADGQLIQGCKRDIAFGYQTIFRYEYLSDPYFCIRDEYDSVIYPNEGPTPSEGRFAIILDSAGQEIESFSLGSPETAKMIYNEAGYLVGVEGIENVYYTKCEFIYNQPDWEQEAPEVVNSDSNGAALTLEQALTLADEFSSYSDGEEQTIDGLTFVVQFWDCGQQNHNGKMSYVFQVRRLMKVDGPQLTQLLDTIYVDAETGACSH